MKIKILKESEISEFSLGVAGGHSKFWAHIKRRSGMFLFKARHFKNNENIVWDEYLCNRMIQYFGLPIPRFELVMVKKEHFFISKNMIKEGRRLVHFSDFLDEEKYNMESIFNLIQEKTHTKKDIDNYLSSLFVDLLICNNDRHLKNYAFIQNGEHFRFSPLYDNTSQFGRIEKLIFLDRLEIFGRIPDKNNELGWVIEHLDFICEKKSLKYIEKLYAKINTELFCDWIDQSETTQDYKKRFKKYIGHTHEEIENYLKKNR